MVEMEDGGRSSRETTRAMWMARWRQLIAEQVGSGQTQEEFCRARGLDLRLFRSWKYEKLRRSMAVARREEATGLPAFVPVHVVSAPSPAPPRPEEGSPGAGVEIVVAEGRRIRVAAGFDATTLARAVLTLEALDC